MYVTVSNFYIKEAKFVYDAVKIQFLIACSCKLTEFYNCFNLKMLLFYRLQGSFPRTDFSFKVYFPASRQIEDSKIGDWILYNIYVYLLYRKNGFICVHVWVKMYFKNSIVLFWWLYIQDRPKKAYEPVFRNIGTFW